MSRAFVLFTAFRECFHGLRRVSALLFTKPTRANRLLLLLSQPSNVEQNRMIIVHILITRSVNDLPPKEAVPA